MERQSVSPEVNQRASTVGVEPEIQNRLQELAEAIRNGQLEKIMAFYSPDITAFDMMPPLRFTDKAAYKDSWEKFFTTYFKFPVTFNYHESNILGNGDVALTHSLVEMSGQSKDGEKMEAWMRNTTGWKKVNGQWLIVHEHNSVPGDPKTGQGLMNLKPENLAH